LKGQQKIWLCKALEKLEPKEIAGLRNQTRIRFEHCAVLQETMQGLQLAASKANNIVLKTSNLKLLILHELGGIALTA